MGEPRRLGGEELLNMGKNSVILIKNERNY
jgi:hypothetical protein